MNKPPSMPFPVHVTPRPPHHPRPVPRLARGRSRRRTRDPGHSPRWKREAGLEPATDCPPIRAHRAASGDRGEHCCDARPLRCGYAVVGLADTRSSNTPSPCGTGEAAAATSDLVVDLLLSTASRRWTMMRARKVRIQHALPWLVEPLEASWRDEEDEADGEPALVAEWREGIGQPETRRAYAREVRLFLNRYGI